MRIAHNRFPLPVASDESALSPDVTNVKSKVLVTNVERLLHSFSLLPLLLS